MNELNAGLPDELLSFDDPSGGNAGPGATGGPAVGAGGGPQTVGPQPGGGVVGPPGQQPNSSVASSMAVSSVASNVVTMAAPVGQQIRPVMAMAAGAPGNSVVTNGVALGGIVTSSSQPGAPGPPIMVQQGPNGPQMRPNGPPGQPVVSNPNINLVNVNQFGGNQTVRTTMGTTVVTNGPIMTLPGLVTNTILFCLTSKSRIGVKKWALRA